MKERRGDAETRGRGDKAARRFAASPRPRVSASFPEAINIGPRERRKRRILGVVALTVGVGIAFVLVIMQAPRWSRAVIFFPIWIAGLGLMQAREKVCIALAASGKCNMDEGEESLDDESAVEKLKEKARRINRRALVTAAAITVLALLFPS